MNKENKSKLPGSTASKAKDSNVGSSAVQTAALLGKRKSEESTSSNDTLSSLAKKTAAKPVAGRMIAKPVTRSSIALSVKKPIAAVKPLAKPKAVIKPSVSAVSKSASSKPPPPKKRKEYDVKGRLLDLEAQHTFTTTQLSESTRQIDSMTSKLDASSTTITELMTFKHSLESAVLTKEHEKNVLALELTNIASGNEVIYSKV